MDALAITHAGLVLQVLASAILFGPVHGIWGAFRRSLAAPGGATWRDVCSRSAAGLHMSGYEESRLSVCSQRLGPPEQPQNRSPVLLFILTFIGRSQSGHTLPANAC